jgi:hypothetical protein
MGSRKLPRIVLGARTMSEHVYKFGSPELADLHARAWIDGQQIRTLAGWNITGNRMDARYVYSRERVIRREFDGYQYVVDHGSFRTLNTMRAGQHAIAMEDV